MIEIIDKDNEMPSKIEWKGDTYRFCQQRTGKLVSVEAAVAKDIDLALLQDCDLVEFERSARTFIVCTYIGERRFPFVDIINYGGSRLLSMQKSIGQIFEIDVPATEAKPVELNFTGEENSNEQG